ncbi:MAG: hypothetical protein QXH07_02030 [Thermoplasmata archaeon]
MDVNKELEIYINYTKTVWLKVKEKFKDEPIEAQAIAFERATTPIKYWLDNGQKQEKKEDIVYVAQKYGLVIDGEILRIPKDRGLEKDAFISLASELEQFGYKYAKGKGYFILESA